MDDLIDKAKEAFDSGEFLRAASYIMDYIAQDPPEEKLQVAYRMRGTARGILGQNDEAKYDLNKALGLNPKDNISRVNRAMVYKEMENYEQSSRDCFHVLDAKEEGMAQAYFCLGEINLKLGQFNTALDYLMKGRDEAKNINDENLVDVFSDKIKNISMKSTWDYVLGKKEEYKPYSF